MNGLSNEVVEYLTWCAEKYLSLRPRSEKELILYLQRKIRQKHKDQLTKSDEYIERVLAPLKESDAVNDVQFIDWWIKERLYFKPKGVRGLTYELVAKGVDKIKIVEYLEKNPVDEVSQIIAILNKKGFSQRDGLTENKGNEKLIQSLMRKGFSFQNIKKAFEVLSGKE